jgi:hypothetical protein
MHKYIMRRLLLVLPVLVLSSMSRDVSALT